MKVFSSMCSIDHNQGPNLGIKWRLLPENRIIFATKTLPGHCVLSKQLEILPCQFKSSMVLCDGALYSTLTINQQARRTKHWNSRCIFRYLITDIRTAHRFETEPDRLAMARSNSIFGLCHTATWSLRQTPITIKLLFLQNNPKLSRTWQTTNKLQVGSLLSRIPQYSRMSGLSNSLQ